MATLLLTFCGAAAFGQTPNFWDDTPNHVLIPQLIDQMTAEELLAQTLLVGWSGQDPSPAVRTWINEVNLGGVKVFGWNGGDLPRLTRALGNMQEAAQRHRLGIPLFTATDQEGGWVRHVRGRADLATFITPGNMALGASGLPSDSFWSGYYIGMELRALGINMNFAPTVDVYVNPEAHVIGPRAFSSDPVQTGILGVAYFHGLEEARVVATAKHFPGHGNATGDSHGILPVVDDSLEELWDRDLVPYRFLISEGLPAILSGHLSFPAITPDGRPASLSRFFKQELLRNRLGFTGVVITDDLYMQGAWQFDRSWGIEDIVVEALRAGSDMVLLSRTPRYGGTIWSHMLATYEQDQEFRAQVKHAVANILQVKLDYIKPDNRVPLIPDADAIGDYIRSTEGAEFFQDQAGRSVTILESATIPISPEETSRTLLVGKDPTFLRIGREFFPQADTLRLSSRWSYSSSAEDRRAFARAADRYDTVIFGLSDPGSMQVLAEGRDSDAAIIAFSTLTPVYIFQQTWIRDALAVYGWGEDSIRAGFSVLIGKIPALGTNPLRIEPTEER